MSENLVLLRNVSKTYQGVTAVNGVTLHINRGDIYGLVGNNGAGKTTLMRMITGQTQPDAGTVELFGETKKADVCNARKRMGALVEDPGLYPNMSARENLEYFRIQFGIPGKEIVDEILKLVGLEKSAKKRYGNFSLGMKQRLGIALALLHTPELLILDEPINGLDPAGIIEIREALLSINRKKNTTILISSHILAEMSNIATKYGFMSNGKLLEEIKAEDLMQKCNSYLDIEVRDAKRLTVLLEQELHYNKYKVYPDGHIHLFDGLEASEQICQMAVEHHLGLVGIQKRVVNLENYYMNMVEGQ